MMLNPSVFLSLLVILSDTINVQAISHLREKRSRGFPSLFGQECQEEGGFPCPQEDCSFQEACQGMPHMLPVAGQFPPRMIRRQQEVPFPEFTEGNQPHQYPLPTAARGQHRWRSPLLSGNRQSQFPGVQPDDHRGPMEMAPRCPPFSGLPPSRSPFPNFHRMTDSKTSRRGPLKFHNQEITNEHLGSRSRNMHGHKMPNNLPPEWGQHCTSQNQPFGEHHELYGEHHRPSGKPPGAPFRQDTCPTTPKPFFFDFMPKYVETVPPPTCPISPAYEPPPKSPFGMSGLERADDSHPQHSFNHFPNEPRFVQPKQYH
uniref:Trefoil factor 1 n=1 Tax=Lygus hesperus TaxID=30085 RepID=A0A0A9Y284_LYGHE